MELSCLWNMMVKAQSMVSCETKLTLFASLISHLMFSPAHQVKSFANQSENLKLLAT